ncbi:MULTISPECIES: PRC-barrel domain-containing protein [unclassified Hyphomicrobium]|uniref:PRC-barrel domain-containing protein n=1 Tax=unclassified Hyphomicrobium TaxID=2619925 RepID=UPI0003079515|nr:MULTISPECIES: PRC-barrel domain-containing protein [unclassified Hyphomicrobium]
MTFSKLRLAPGMALVVSMSCFCVSQAQPVWCQEQDQQAPAEGEQTAPEQTAPEQAAPADGGAAAQPSGDSAEPSAAPSEQAPADSGTEAPPADSGATEAPAQPEQPAATEGAPAEGGTAINASQIQIGAAVFGSDGAKIGEVNGVKSDDSGKVQEILVTDGMPAGINAKVFEVPADKISSVADGVKLSLTSEEAKQLPIIDNSNG